MGIDRFLESLKYGYVNEKGINPERKADFLSMVDEYAKLGIDFKKSFEKAPREGVLTGDFIDPIENYKSAFPILNEIHKRLAEKKMEFPQVFIDGFSWHDATFLSGIFNKGQEEGLLERDYQTVIEYLEVNGRLPYFLEKIGEYIYNFRKNVEKFGYEDLLWILGEEIFKLHFWDNIKGLLKIFEKMDLGNEDWRFEERKGIYKKTIKEGNFSELVARYLEGRLGWEKKYAKLAGDGIAYDFSSALDGNLEDLPDAMDKQDDSLYSFIGLAELPLFRSEEGQGFLSQYVSKSKNVSFDLLNLSRLQDAGFLTSDLVNLFEKFKGGSRYILAETLVKNLDLCKKIRAQGYWDRHVEFYKNIGEKYGNPAGFIAQGIMEALNKGYIKIELTDKEQLLIQEFSDATKSFSPLLFHLFSKGEKKDHFFDEMEYFSQVIQRGDFEEKHVDVLRNIFSISDREELIETVLAVFQMVIPPTDSSFISYDDALRMTEAVLFADYSEEGALIDHVPSSLKGFVKAYNVGIVERKRKEGVESKEGAIRQWIERFRNLEFKNDKNVRDQKRIALEEELKKYMMDQSRINDLRKAFYEFLHNHEGFQQAVFQILLMDDYYSMLNNISSLIHDQFKDIIKEMQKDLNKEAGVSARLGRSIRNKKNLLSQLSKMPLSAVDKLLTTIDSESLRGIKESLKGEIEDEGRREKIEKVIDGVLGKRPKGPVLNVAEMNLPDILWNKELKIFNGELDSYDLKVNKNKNVIFRVVKGFPYVVWGLNCGVCIGKDLKLFSDSNFMFLSIQISDSGIIEGFVHLYSATLSDGRRVLLIPGINPTSTLNVEAESLVNALVQTFQNISDLEGYDDIFLPADLYIATNRVHIRKAIKGIISDHKLEPIELDKEISWDGENAHPVKSVYSLKNISVASDVVSYIDGDLDGPEEALERLKSNLGGIDLNPKDLNIEEVGDSSIMQNYAEAIFLKNENVINIDPSSVIGIVPIITNISPIYK